MKSKMKFSDFHFVLFCEKIAKPTSESILSNERTFSNNKKSKNKKNIDFLLHFLSF